MLAKRPHEDTPSGSSPKKQRIKYIIHPADDNKNNSSSSVGRKRSIEDTENDPPYKKGKAHATPTDKDTPAQPANNNTIPQPTGGPREGVNGVDSESDFVNHMCDFMATHRSITPVQEDNTQELEQPEVVEDVEDVGEQEPEDVEDVEEQELENGADANKQNELDIAQSSLPLPSPGTLFIRASTEPLPPPGLALNREGSPPSPGPSFIRSNSEPLPSSGSALVREFSPPSPGPLFIRSSTEPLPPSGHALGQTYSPLSPGPYFIRSSSEPLPSSGVSYGYASTVQPPSQDNADNSEQEDSSSVELDAPLRLSAKELDMAYKDEILSKAMSYMCDAEPKVVNLAEPEVAVYREKAAAVAGNVCMAMHYFRTSSSLDDSIPVLASLIEDESTRAIELAHSAHDDVLRLAIGLEEDSILFSHWADAEALGSGAGTGAAYTAEHSIFSGAEAIIMFVARLLEGFNNLSEDNQDFPKLRRLLLPSFAIDFEAADAQGNGRLVLGLEAKSIANVLANSSNSAASGVSEYAEVSDEWYAGLFAAIEVRPGMLESDEEDAKLHLAKRSRNIYRTQPNRRFLWGLTICGSFVRAYLFGPNFVLDSEDLNMDISTEAGCNEVIKMFVNLSFTEDYRLGYDPTIKRLHDLDCWEITVPMTSANGRRSTGSCTYYSNKVLEADDHILGSHKRRFLATMAMPTADEPIHDEGCTAVVHDVWSELLRPVRKNFCDDDFCDEIHFLKQINGDFLGNMELNGTYPVLAECGIARFKCGPQQKPADDTNYGILGDLYDEPSNPLGTPITGCVHRRYVTGLIGSPLTEITSAGDLAAVVVDIMETCRQIYAVSGYVHLNLSPDTMRFRRLEDNSIRGMLLGLDCLARREKPSAAHPNGNLGTPQFLSVNAIERNSNPLTELDEWESLIYVLHSVVLHRWKRLVETETKTDADVGIDTELDNNLAYLKRWDEKTKSFDSSAKRECLDNSATFARYLNTLDDTIPGCREIKELLSDLRGALIESRCYHKDAVGALIRERKSKEVDPFSEDPVDLSPMVDPFRIRADWVIQIASRLKDILAFYAANLG
ncbi:hypothetical protein GGF37_000461 [Kickxella alabastrina]|nr:hypothetical protein GGF37_000461 [Kickxella alabastrina]